MATLRSCHSERTNLSNDYSSVGRLMLVAFWMSINLLEGKAALQFSPELGVQYKTAWVLSLKIKEALGYRHGGLKTQLVEQIINCAGNKSSYARVYRCLRGDEVSTKSKAPARRRSSYQIIVVKAHGGSLFRESTERYYSGDLYFMTPDGTGTTVGVNKHTLGLRKTFWCVPEDIDKDARARLSEYNRYVPALNLYNQFWTITGKRYELERASNTGLPLLPVIRTSDI